MLGLLLLALLQTSSPGGTSRVTVDVMPRSAAIRAGDTLRLRAQVSGAAADAPVVWRAAGEGTVDQTGLVRAGYAGYVRVTATAAVIVHPRPTAWVEIRPVVRRIVAGSRVTLNGWAFSVDGDRTYEPVAFISSNPRVAAITAEGRLTAVSPGSATITAEAGAVAERTVIAVLPNTVARVTVTPAATSVRTGDVVRFTAAALDRAGRPVPDVFTEWSVAAMTYKAVGQIDGRGAFVAEWPGKYTITADIGGRRADAVVEVRRRDTGSAVEVLGRLPLPIGAEALWVHPAGRCGYIGTSGGPVYVVDVSRADGVRVVDSMLAGGAQVASIMTSGKTGVFTREHGRPGSAGLVVFDASDPCRPRLVAEHPATDSTGVRAAWLDGSHAYIADAATGSLRVLDLSSPSRPREVARWQTTTEPGRRLDDVSVEDGVAYLAYWNDGLVILDVGNGIKSGSPERPALVAQYRYDLNDMYARVDRTLGLGPRGTHTARRAGKFVLITDEVLPPGASHGWSGPVFGRLNAIDVADLTRPNGVAWYEPTDALAERRHALPRRVPRRAPGARCGRRAQGRPAGPGPRDRVALDRGLAGYQAAPADGARGGRAERADLRTRRELGTLDRPIEPNAGLVTAMQRPGPAPGAWGDWRRPPPQGPAADLMTARAARPRVPALSSSAPAYGPPPVHRRCYCS